MISGLTLNNLKHYVKHQTATGIHPSVTMASLNQFERDYGSSPEAFQLAQPNMIGNRPGYMSIPKPIVKVGDVVEADIMECDINDVTETTIPSASAGGSKKKKRGKKNQFQSDTPEHATPEEIPAPLPDVIDMTIPTSPTPPPAPNTRKKVSKMQPLGVGYTSSLLLTDTLVMSMGRFYLHCNPQKPTSNGSSRLTSEIIISYKHLLQMLE